MVWSPFTIFGSDRFSIIPQGPDGTVSWDLTGTGYRLNFVLVESNEFIANLYRVSGLERFAGNGSITINGVIPIDAVVFAGTNRVPDTGSALALMGIAVGAVFFLHRRIKTVRYRSRAISLGAQ